VPATDAAGLVWFRRDLRVDDHTALAWALTHCHTVYAVFVFDTEVLAGVARSASRRVAFLWHSVAELSEAIRQRGGSLCILQGRARDEIPALASRLNVRYVCANEDYEPAARARDEATKLALDRIGVEFRSFRDSVIFARDELLTQSGAPFSVFTPYKRAWLARLDTTRTASHDTTTHSGKWVKAADPVDLPSLSQLGFDGDTSILVRPGMTGARALIEDFAPRMSRYHEARDYPAVRGVSYLSAHNRFGTCSVRELVRLARRRKGGGAEVWLSELIWREFYFQVLWHHPHVVNGAFKRRYDALAWRNDEHWFSAWCEGRTGFPIVDAAMRQLNTTGYMHNRLRMIVASFLTKDLLIDWRWGERYFADHLIDHDLAANNGGWQWAASTGCDAQPYFRIFNPVTQSERFDPQGKFIRRYVPELERVPDAFIHAPWKLSAADQRHLGVLVGRDYPMPVVDHAVQRTLASRLFDEVRETR